MHASHRAREVLAERSYMLKTGQGAMAQGGEVARAGVGQPKDVSMHGILGAKRA